MATEAKQDEILTLLRDIANDSAEMRSEHAQEIAELRQELSTVRQQNYELAMRLQNLPAATVNQESLRHFTLFPNLPPELRTRIWMMACFNEPRVIKLYVEYPGQDWNYYCRGNYPPPVVHTSSESREEALKWYKRRAVDREMLVNLGGTELIYKTNRTPETYFNFDIDILFPVVDDDWKELSVGACLIETVTKSQAMRQFQRIAVPWGINSAADYETEWTENAYFLLRRRSKIREMLVVYGADRLLENEQCLIPMTGSDMILDSEPVRGPCYVTVDSKLEEISGFLASAELNDWYDGDICSDHEYEDEAPERDSTKRPRDRSTRHRTIHGDSIEAQRKPSPTVRFVAMRDRFPVRQPRIYMA